MDNILVSDRVLNQQICTECHNYLSVGPVLVSRDGKIICGRCSKATSTAANASQKSLYNLVAEKLIFKCINRYMGCEELLFFNEAVEHEKTCKKKDLRCLFCEFEGNGCRLVDHFGREHPEVEVVKDGIFKMTFGRRCLKTLVLVENNCIFCIRFFIGHNIVYISNLLITPANLGPERFRLKFFRHDLDIPFITSQIQIVHDYNDFPISKENVNGRKKCFLLDQNDVLNYLFPSKWCLCEIKLLDTENYFNSEEKHLNYVNKIFKKIDIKLPTNNAEKCVASRAAKWDDFNFISKMSISDLRKFVQSELFPPPKCENCENEITARSFCVCIQNHILCNECKKNKCHKCATLGKKHFLRPNSQATYNLSLPCEWRNCFEDVHIFQYVEHKRDCRFRIYKCPDVGCGFVGQDLRHHGHRGSIPIEYFSHASVYLPKQNRTFYCLTLTRELYHVNTEFDNKSRKFSVTITEVDVVKHEKYEFNLYLVNPRQIPSDPYQVPMYRTLISVPYSNPWRPSPTYGQVLGDIGQMPRINCPKTKSILSCGNESTCFVKFLNQNELTLEFQLEQVSSK